MGQSRATFLYSRNDPKWLVTEYFSMQIETNLFKRQVNAVTNFKVKESVQRSYQHQETSECLDKAR
jgi:hypothetical protein